MFFKNAQLTTNFRHKKNFRAWKKIFIYHQIQVTGEKIRFISIPAIWKLITRLYNFFTYSLVSFLSLALLLFCLHIYFIWQNEKKSEKKIVF